MAIKKSLRSCSPVPDVSARSARVSRFERAAAGGTEPQVPIPWTAIVDACRTRTQARDSQREPATAASEGSSESQTGPLAQTDPATPRYVTMRWSDVEELHSMLNAIEKERKRLEEKLALMSDVLEENSLLRATVQLLERERRSG
jgi:hypothetical protein